MHKKTLNPVFFLALLFISKSAISYVTFSDGSGGILKWGTSHTPGTPGGTVTWGFIPAGTSGDTSYCGDACQGTSSTSIKIENSPGTGYTSTPLTDLEDTITDTFNKWSTVANINFVGPSGDSALPINDPGASSPDIRIGVFSFASGGGAVGFAPPPNGGTGAGDILFDSNSFYAFQPGNEGDSFPDTSTAPNDFVSLLLHEIGHTLGLGHPTFDGSCPVMQTNSNCLGIINRELDADDIAGAKYIYGSSPVPLPAAFWLLGSALAGLTGFSSRIRSA